MRELEARLTTETFVPTLRRGGVFMPDGTQIGVIEGEVEPQLPIPETRTRPESPLKKWEKFLEEKKGSRLSRDEQRVLDIAGDLDIELPKEAGEVKDPTNEETWKPNKLRDIYMRFSTGFIARNGSPGARFISNKLAEIQIARDNGEISSSEAREFTAQLNKFLAEAQDREEVKVMELAKEIAAQEGITGELDEQDIAVQGLFKDRAKSKLNLQVNNPPGGNAGVPPFPGWIIGPGGVWMPPGGGGAGGGGGVPPGGIPPGGAPPPGGGRTNRRPFLSPRQRQEEAAELEFQRLRLKFRRAIGGSPNHPAAGLRRNELLTAVPDLNKPIFEDLRNIISNLNPSDTTNFYRFATIIADLNTNPNNPDRDVSEETRRLLFEAVYEKLIGIPDRGSPEQHYKIGAFRMLDLVDELDGLAGEKFGPQFKSHISELAHVRQVMHELNIALKTGEQYKELVLKELSASGLDFVYNDIAGVNQVFAQIEKVAGNMVSRGRKEWLSDGDWKQIYKEVSEIFSDTDPDAERLSVETLDNQGNIVSRNLTEWEKARAIKLAQIFHAGMQRRGMYSFLGDLPPMAFSSGRIASTQDVFIGRNLMAGKKALQFFPGKKEKGKTSAAEGSKVFIKHIIQEEENKSPDSYNLLVFGLNKATVIFNQYGASDLMSHSWRTPKEFYDQISFIGPNGQPTTLLALLGERIRALDPTNQPTDPNRDPVLGGGELGDTEKAQLSQDLKTYVLGQRLYLSVLPRHGNFDDSLKTEIWKKISILKPSTIATLLPDTVENNPVWEGMRKKLFAAEGKRVKQDSLSYYQPQTLQAMQAEVTAFENAKTLASSPGQWSAQQFTEMANYMGMGNVDFSAEEKQLLEHIIRSGVNRSADLTKAKMSFTFMIDDAPKISLKPTERQFGGLSDADDIRLIASDQQTLSEGWDEGLNSLIENPSSKMIEHWVKVVTGNARVHGRDNALKTCRPFLLAWLQMARKENDARWIPFVDTFKRAVEQYTSEMTKYFPTSKISQDTQEQKNTIMAAGQLVGMSEEELALIKKRSNTDAFWIFIYMLHGIAEVLGPVAAKEFAKLITPSLKA